MIANTIPHSITALLALGMALAFVVADRQSQTSRALAWFLWSIGVSVATATLVALPLHLRHGVPAWDGVFALPEVMAYAFAYEWVLRVRRTVPARNLRTRGADVGLRVSQGLAALYGVAALAFPALRSEYFVNLRAGLVNILEPGFWLFGAPLGLSLLLGIAATLFTLNRRPDRAEALRLKAFVIAAPFMASGMMLPFEIAPLSMAIGLLVFLVGAVQYHVTQGRRAQFMARFLAPQVAALVNERGLKSATDEQTLEITVVCCDLRGFTAFSAATSSTRVIQIMREYYDTVGNAAQACGGTIKDQAGDGVLILVGAPAPFADHAQRGLDLAQRIRIDGIALTARCSDAEQQLGIGVGVASGYVTVGVIGSASRLEYTAVGPAVNLASRLCAEAAHGEVVVDARTTEILRTASHNCELRPGQELRLKGFSQPVPSFVLEPAGQTTLIADPL
ncbi:MAG: adenylate/guanylate cyclase domain-containing protein [Planctomycetota bacterium]